VVQHLSQGWAHSHTCAALNTVAIPIEHGHVQHRHQHAYNADLCTACCKETARSAAGFERSPGRQPTLYTAPPCEHHTQHHTTSQAQYLSSSGNASWHYSGGASDMFVHLPYHTQLVSLVTQDWLRLPGVSRRQSGVREASDNRYTQVPQISATEKLCHPSSSCHLCFT
jgi:hypothetical protein